VLQPLAMFGGDSPGQAVTLTGTDTTTDSKASDVKAISAEMMAGDDSRLTAMRMYFTDPHHTTVRGHDAIAGTLGDQTTGVTGFEHLSVLMWSERPGELIRVFGANVSDADLRTVAEGLQPASDTEWAKLVERTKLGDFQPDAQRTELGRGTFPDGTPWVLRVQARGATDLSASTELSVAVGSGETSSGGGFSDSASSSGGSSTGTSDPVPFPSTTTSTIGGRHFASGLLADAVDKVELRRADGSVIEDALIVSGHGYRAWLAELTVDKTTVVALDRTGKELARMTLEQGADGVSTSSSGPTTATSVPVTSTTGG